jgi:hypothetical protein
MTNFIRNCEWCGNEFQTEWETKTYCTRQHKESARRFRKGTRRHTITTLHLRQCKGCSNQFSTRKANQVYCGNDCANWYKEQVKRERDRLFINSKTPALKRRIYFKTDGRCGICKSIIDLSLKYPDPASFSIDHIIPRSQGGTHGFDNLQPAHLACNAKRGNKSLD